MLDKLVLVPPYPSFRVYAGKKYHEIVSVDIFVRKNVGAIVLEHTGVIEDIVLTFNNEKDLDTMITKLMELKAKMAFEKENAK